MSFKVCFAAPNESLTLIIIYYMFKYVSVSWCWHVFWQNQVFSDRCSSLVFQHRLYLASLFLASKWSWIWYADMDEMICMIWSLILWIFFVWKVYFRPWWIEDESGRNSGQKRKVSFGVSQGVTTPCIYLASVDLPDWFVLIWESWN